MGEMAPAFSALAGQTDAQNRARALLVVSLETAREVLGLYDDNSQNTRLEEHVLPASLAVVEDLVSGPATALDRVDYYPCFGDVMALTERASVTPTLKYFAEDGTETDVAAGTFRLDATRAPMAVRFFDGAPSLDLYAHVQNPVSATYAVQPFKGSPAGSYAVAEAFKKILVDLYRGSGVDRETKLTAERILSPYARDLGI